MHTCPHCGLRFNAVLDAGQHDCPVLWRARQEAWLYAGSVRSSPLTDGIVLIEEPTAVELHDAWLDWLDTLPTTEED